ncbi:MAG: type II secretion system protein GspM [Acidobacteriota bacterium]
MTLAARDQRALKYLGLSIAALGIYWFWPAGMGVPASAGGDTVEVAEQRLAHLRDIAATAPAKQEVLKKVASELATRESGLIRADSAQQAGAQVGTIVRQLLVAESLDTRSMEFGAVEAFGDIYGLVPVTIQMECHVEQLVNLLAALEARKELLATRDIQITASNPMQKTIRVRLSVVGVVPQSLVPKNAKKGASGL